MADTNKIESLQNLRRGGASTPADEAKSAAGVVWTLVRDQLLRSGQDPQRAPGPMLRAAVKSLAGNLADAIETKDGGASAPKGTGRVPAQAIKSAVEVLLDLHAKESFARTKPATVDERNGELHRKVELAENADGTFRALGEASAEGHGLAILTQGLGLDLKGLEAPVADIVRKAATSRNFHNLGRLSTWRKVASDALGAFLTTSGNPHMRAAAAALSGAHALVSETSGPPPKTDDTLERGPRPRNGLESRAGALSGVGTIHNATNIRAALMTGAKLSPVIEKTANGVAQAAYAALGVEPDKATRTRIHARLTELLRDPQAPKGHAEPRVLLQRALAALAQRDPGRASLVELGKLVERTLARRPDSGASEVLDESLAHFAAAALGDVVAHDLGRAPVGGPELEKALDAAIDEIVERRDPPPVEPEAGPRNPPDLTRWRDRTDLPPALLRAAEGALRRVGVGPDHPLSDPLRNAVAELLGPVTAAGVAPELGLAMALKGFLVDHAGANRSEAEAVLRSLEETGGALAEQKALLQSLEQQKGRLEEQSRRGPVSEKARLEPQITRLMGEISILEAQVRSNEQTFAGEVQVQLDHGLHQLIAWMTFGGSEGSQVNDDGPPVDPESTPEVEPLEMGPQESTPEVEPYEVGHITLQQRRAIAIDKILEDPSLSMEDAIFLFLLTYAAFTDRERKNKMKELAG
ncbi:MAG: hypothetical protein AAFZ18_37820, partial [Myxococcota bacterium]